MSDGQRRALAVSWRAETKQEGEGLGIDFEFDDAMATVGSENDVSIGLLALAPLEVWGWSLLSGEVHGFCAVACRIP